MGANSDKSYLATLINKISRHPCVQGSKDVGDNKSKSDFRHVRMKGCMD